jgi:hypothetical protein
LIALLLGKTSKTVHQRKDDLWVSVRVRVRVRVRARVRVRIRFSAVTGDEPEVTTDDEDTSSLVRVVAATGDK